MAQGHAMQIVPPETRDNLPIAEEIDESTAGQIVRQSAATPAPDGGAGNVEKIRDILFGTQIREYENRFLHLEENIVKEINGLREDTKKRFEALETHITNEIEAVQKRIRSERDERTESSEQAARDVAALGNALGRKISELDDQTAQADRQLRLELLQQSKEFMENLRSNQDQLTALLGSRFQELRNDKTDRTALATLFAELSMKLKGELQAIEAKT
jgi:hypothetical protein